MQYITEHQARRLAHFYLADSTQKFIVYNIRQRSYLLHDYYKFYFRFSRRESVWNTPLFNIEEMSNNLKDMDELTKVILTHINKYVDDVLSLQLKREFTLEDCEKLLNYYFNGKTYIAFYDFYLGRVVLIKERDKSNDFGELIGSRYQLIGNLHNIITKSIGLDHHILEKFMTELVVTDTPIREIVGFDEINQALHAYLSKQIDDINEWVTSQQAKAKLAD
ncbi:hypothetical protein ACF3NG_08950 [Aerococcaceae bacterium WGS1372]